MNSRYKVLTSQVVSNGTYSLVPIRMDDRYDIMRWRNEQLYHLRQTQPLTCEDQDRYFSTIIAGLFEQEKPNQILFSYLEGDKCIGYGGLVHINWTDKNAEISFVMETRLEKEDFVFHWFTFLLLIKSIAFKELQFYKIFTYAFDLRPNLYPILLNSGFREEARLKSHIFFQNKYIDALIHTCFNPLPTLFVRRADFCDIMQLFEWVNDPLVRLNALNQNPISWENHLRWYNSQHNSESCNIYIFTNLAQVSVGQVRISHVKDEWIIDYSVDRVFRGLGLGKLMISKIVKLHPNFQMKAVVRKVNIPSILVFSSLGFREIDSDDQFVYFLKR